MNRTRSTLPRFAVAALLAALLAAGSASAGPLRSVDAPAAAAFAGGEVIVRYKPGVSAAERARARDRVGAALERRLPIPRVELLELKPGTAVGRAVAKLQRRAEVDYAEPNYIYELAALPNDPRFTNLWGLDRIAAPQAWATTTGSSEVVVGVVDTGVDLEHPDLAANLWTNPGETGDGKEMNGVDDDGNGYPDDVHGWDWVGSDFEFNPPPPPDNDPSDGDGHGTHVAGTIGAVGNNAEGIVGVNWDVSLMALRVCGLNGCKNSDIASAFAYAGANGADVVNASLSGPSLSKAMADAIAAAPQVLFVVAAGNSGSDNDSLASPQYPCNYPDPNLLCVAASTQGDALASFSNYGPESVDLAAPGVSVDSTYAFETPVSYAFEATTLPAGWTTGGSHNTWGTTHVKKESGARSLTDSPAQSPAFEQQNYLPNTNSWAATPALDLTGRSECRLRYWLSLNVAAGDVLRVEASSDGEEFDVLRAWSGTGTAVLAHDLSDYDGESSLRIRLRLVANGDQATGDGAYVDNLQVRCAASNYRFLSGTSMASPHVAGAAALLLADDPEGSIEQLRNRLLGSADPLPSLAGKVASGGRLNLAAALGYDGEPSSGEPVDGGSVAQPPASDPAPATKPAFCQPLRKKLRRARFAFRRTRAAYRRTGSSGHRRQARRAKHRFLKLRKRYLRYCKLG